MMLQLEPVRRLPLMGLQAPGVVLTSVSAVRWDLRRANLDGANLDSADLQGADLQDADLQGTILQDAHIDDAGHLG